MSFLQIYKIYGSVLMYDDLIQLNSYEYWNDEQIAPYEFVREVYIQIEIVVGDIIHTCWKSVLQ